jgi:D-alanyl-D-alanine carboxypeptidase/D-alanyl-D-alanine-endopeptidase (penicillin-binding protein 4)
VALRHTAPRSEGALASDLAYMLRSRTRSGAWGAMVVSLTRGDTLFKHDADARLQPASTMKMYTSVSALERLGPDHQLSTDVLRAGTVSADGTLQGSLVLRGAGDPAFSNRFLPGDPSAPVNVLAEYVARAGIKRVRGELVGDASAFDGQLIPDGWDPRNLGSGYAAPVSALSINENLLWLAVTPGGAKGAARVALEPATTALRVESSVRTVAGSGAQITAYRGRDGAIVARGWIGSRAPTRRYSLVINEPAAYTLGAFRAALAARGVVVEGSERVGPTPAGAVRVTGLPSPPLSRVIAYMNRESNNHYAELLFRDAARGRRGEQVGSAAAGNATLQQILRDRVGVAPGAVHAADGSGLSTLDQVTARSMVQLLGYAHRAPWGSVFHASLPVAGGSGTLKGHMRYTPAQGNLHAKTGTTNRVVSLGGYVTAADGEVLAFSFIYNGTDRWNARSTIDAMGATMAGFARE